MQLNATFQINRDGERKYVIKKNEKFYLHRNDEIKKNNVIAFVQRLTVTC